MFTRPSLVSILDLGPVDACFQLSTQLPRMTAQVKSLYVKQYTRFPNKTSPLL